MKRKVKYELPELKEIERIADDFFKRADEFIENYKKNHKEEV